MEDENAINHYGNTFKGRIVIKDKKVDLDKFHIVINMYTVPGNQGTHYKVNQI